MSRVKVTHTAEQERLPFFLFHTFLFLFKPGTCISHNTTMPLSDITGDHLSDYMQLSSDKRFYTSTYKHALLCTEKLNDLLCKIIIISGL